MIKKIFRPFWSYDVQKTEAWLSTLAEKGYLLVKMNRITRTFFFQHGEPKKITYRIGYDKIQGDSLSRGLLAEGWTKVMQRGNWYITANEKPLEQIKASPVREGIIKHNRLVMYIFSAVSIYLSFVALFNLMMMGLFAFEDVPVEVVDSPYWIVTYIFMGIGIATLVLSFYSVIKIIKSNKKLISEKSTITGHYGMDNLDRKRTKDEEKRMKRSGQLVVKRKFGWMYAPDKVENWLEALEEQGYNLYRVGKTGTVFFFIKGCPRKVSYCAEYQNIADESYFVIHSDAGWKCKFHSLGSLQKWSIWSREYADGEERPQIYSDKSHQLKHARRIAIAYSCLFLPLVIMYLFNMRLSFELLIRNNFDKLQVMTILLFAIAILSFGSFVIRTWLYYMRLKKRF